MDWSDIDLSWITLSVHGPKVATPNMSCFTVIKAWCLRSLTFRSPYVVKTTNIQCHWLPVILFICNQTHPDSNVSSVQFGRERGREYENSALKIQEMLSERSKNYTFFRGGHAPSSWTRLRRLLSFTCTISQNSPRPSPILWLRHCYRNIPISQFKYILLRKLILRCVLKFIICFIPIVIHVHIQLLS